MKMKTAQSLAIFALIFAACSSDDSTSTDDASGTTATDGTGGTSGTTATDGTSTETTTYRGEVWADNWSSMYVGTTKVMEDSVSITTERSFNAETFTFEATRPFLLNVVMKDYKANDSGLEYIGAGNQQMGDGGYIAQITEVSTGSVVAVSNAQWKCLTTHIAPLDKSCEGSSDPTNDCTWETTEEPADWKNDDFDDSGWVNPTVHSEAAVSPKDGYDEITWDSAAALIWGADLETHNTLLCRVWVN
ncbi:MAG: hypothetical protein ACI9OJ_000490 [Myxococcota bacterium]|jgi:hypothetical protein